MTKTEKQAAIGAGVLMIFILGFLAIKGLMPWKFNDAVLVEQGQYSLSGDVMAINDTLARRVVDQSWWHCIPSEASSTYGKCIEVDNIDRIEILKDGHYEVSQRNGVVVVKGEFKYHLSNPVSTDGDGQPEPSNADWDTREGEIYIRPGS